MTCSAGKHRAGIGDVGEGFGDVVVGIDEAVSRVQLLDGLARGLPAAPVHIVEDVAALTVIDEIVEVDLEPELTHPVVMCAPPRIGESGCVGKEIKSQTTAGGGPGGGIL